MIETDERIFDALDKQDPKPPIVHELGGDYYYTCHWMKCGESLYRWMEYCPSCGQKILWLKGEHK